MMKISLIVSLLVLLGSLSWGDAHLEKKLSHLPAASAFRLPNESAEQAYRRFLQRNGLRNKNQDPQNPTVSAAAKPYSQLNFNTVPRWPTAQTTLAAFKKVRDYRFLKDSKHGQMDRRSSWLFPDDGCFARASLMGQNLEKWGAPRPAKLFIFGNLNVNTSNSPSGSVSWWYHVVPLVMVGQIPVVLDPAIQPGQPMNLKDWILTMVPNVDQAKLSICNSYAYGPSDSCYKATSETDKRALPDQQYYLGYEWDRLLVMKRDPVKELGDSPPW